MSNQVQSSVNNGCNPFQPIRKEVKPVASITDYLKDSDKFIIEFGEVEHIKKTGEKDTDFIIEKEVREISRVDRQDLVNSYRDDVGILNIIEKVRLSGDLTLLNQTHRVGVPGSEKDALGRPVEDVADYSQYQVDKIEALEAFKKGILSSKQLSSIEEFSGLTFKDLAKLSDSDLDAVLSKISDRLTPKEGNTEGGKD